MASGAIAEVGFRPMVGTALWNNGKIVAHERVIDSFGRFHGLIRLVIDGQGNVPNVDTWKTMLLTGAVVKAVIDDQMIAGKITILYKFEEKP